MSDDDKIEITQRDAAQRLAQGVRDFAEDFAKTTGTPPAAVQVGLMSAVIGLSCKTDGLAATVRWLHDMGDSLERAKDPSFVIHPEGTA